MMDRQNVTLSIPRDVLKKAKHLAIDKQTTLSGLLTSTLEGLVAHEENYREACKRQLQLLDKGLDLGLQGQVSWTREEVHER